MVTIPDSFRAAVINVQVTALANKFADDQESLATQYVATAAWFSKAADILSCAVQLDHFNQLSDDETLSLAETVLIQLSGNDQHFADKIMAAFTAVSDLNVIQRNDNGRS